MKIYYLIYIIICAAFIYTINRKYYKKEKYVMISASEPYTLYLPLAAKAWNRIGFGCIIVVVYKILTKRLNFVIDCIKEINSIIIKLKVKGNDDVILISKIARIFAFINLPLDFSVVLVTADADILPVKKEYFLYNNTKNIILKSFGINGYGKFPANKRWPMSYIMMTLNNWRILLRKELQQCSNIYECTKNVIDDAYNKSRYYYGGSFGYVDEVYMRDKIRNSDFFPNLLTFDIHKSYDRISCNNLRKKNNDDIHLPRINNKINWIVYIYCLANEYYEFNIFIKYINRYVNFFNVSFQ